MSLPERLGMRQPCGQAGASQAGTLPRVAPWERWRLAGETRQRHQWRLDISNKTVEAPTVRVTSASTKNLRWHRMVTHATQLRAGRHEILIEVGVGRFR
jgi:hypothetical protein